MMTRAIVQLYLGFGGGSAYARNPLIISELANGIADETLSTQALAYDGPVLIAPAMNVRMYNNKAVQKNLSYLRSLGVYFIGPVAGHLASLITAASRMVEPVIIFAKARRFCWQGVNSRTGKMGYALVDAASGFGAIKKFP